MSTDPAIIDLASRLADLEEQAERLESLEYGTLAFPSGGGLSPICDVVLAATALTVTLCPLAPIPSAFRHLLIVHSVQSGPASNALQLMGLQFNGDTATNYHYYRRQESVGPANAEASAGTSTAAFIRVGDTSGVDSPAGIVEHFNAGFIFIPDYADSTNDKWKSLVYGCFLRSALIDAAGGLISYQAGGGGWENTAAITSITVMGAGVATVFQIGSRWTLYGL